MGLCEMQGSVSLHTGGNALVERARLRMRGRACRDLPERVLEWSRGLGSSAWWQWVAVGAWVVVSCNKMREAERVGAGAGWGWLSRVDPEALLRDSIVFWEWETRSAAEGGSGEADGV